MDLLEQLPTSSALQQKVAQPLMPCHDIIAHRVKVTRKFIVLDLDIETDAVVLGLYRYSNVSEPGSPSTAASLDRAAALASATLSTSATEGTAADDLGLPPTLNLIDFDDHRNEVPGTELSVSTEGSDQPHDVGPLALGAVPNPVGTHPSDVGAASYPVMTASVLGAADMSTEVMRYWTPPKVLFSQLIRFLLLTIWSM